MYLPSFLHIRDGSTEGLEGGGRGLDTNKLQTGGRGPDINQFNRK